MSSLSKSFPLDSFISLPFSLSSLSKSFPLDSFISLPFSLFSLCKFFSLCSCTDFTLLSPSLLVLLLSFSFYFFYGFLIFIKYCFINLFFFYIFLFLSLLSIILNDFHAGMSVVENPLITDIIFESKILLLLLLIFYLHLFHNFLCCLLDIHNICLLFHIHLCSFPLFLLYLCFLFYCILKPCGKVKIVFLYFEHNKIFCTCHFYFLILHILMRIYQHLKSILFIFL